MPSVPLYDCMCLVGTYCLSPWSAFVNFLRVLKKMLILSNVGTQYKTYLQMIKLMSYAVQIIYILIFFCLLNLLVWEEKEKKSVIKELSDFLTVL